MSCCLVVALPLAGLSTRLSAALGSIHFHQPMAVVAAEQGPMAGWNDFRRANHVADSVVRLHDHSKLGRHHHDANDASRVTVGAGESDDGVDGVGAAVVTIALAAAYGVALRVPVPSVVGVAWIAADACSFHSCESRRLDRPPIA